MKYYLHNLHFIYINKSVDASSETEAINIAWDKFGLDCCDDFYLFTEIKKNKMKNEFYRQFPRTEQHAFRDKETHMKQLFINGNSTTLFFSEKASFDDIFEWVQEQVMFSDTNIFSLNEQRSCSVSNAIDGMCISGDEDFKRVTIETMTPII